MISVVTWKWSRPGYRSQFTSEHVNALRRMVDRHYSPAAPMVCVTNDATGIDPRVEIVADTEDFADLPSPHGGLNPTCYRRLRAFHPDAEQWFGPKFVSIDLDVVATGDLRPIWDRPEDFVAYRDPYHGDSGQYCGSMWLLRAGSRPEVWAAFDPKLSPVMASAKFRGSDQAWISYAAPGAPTWSPADGVYSYRVDVQRKRLPADARMVIFHGATDPWTATSVPWVWEHYPMASLACVF